LIVNNQVCTAQDGRITYQEVFNEAAGYEEGDLLRIDWYGGSVTIDGEDYFISTTGTEIYQQFVSIDRMPHYEIQAMPSVPVEISLSDQAIVCGLGLRTSRGDLPTTAEITPGTITISRKQPNDAAWTTIVNGDACSEATGKVFYVETFNAGAGYEEGDLLMIQFNNVYVSMEGRDYQIAGASGGEIRVYSEIVRTPDWVIIPTLNVPPSLDLDTRIINLSMGLTTNRGVVPTTGEITPGVVSIYRKRSGDGNWTTVVNGAACSGASGKISYDYAFSEANGWEEGDSYLVVFYYQDVTIDGKTYEISDVGGIRGHGEIRREPDWVIIPVPHEISSIEIDSTAVQIGFSIRTNRGALPTTAEIDPGTYLIYSKQGNGAWGLRASGDCTEVDGNISTLEQFTTSSNYKEGDTVQAITGINSSVTIDGKTYEIVGAAGIRQTFEIRRSNIPELIPMFPKEIALDDGVITLGFKVRNTLGGDTYTTGETGAGTIVISRRQAGDGAWDVIVNVAMNEVAGLLYYNEEFNETAGYKEGDIIMIECSGQEVVAGGNTFTFHSNQPYRAFAKIVKTSSIQAVPIIPSVINLEDSGVIRMGVRLLDINGEAIPSGSITPGTISIQRRAVGGDWALVVNTQPLTAWNGFVFYDETFDSGSGYAEGDQILITFTGMSVTIGGIQHDVFSTVTPFYTRVSESGLAKTGADNDTLETLSDQIDSITGYLTSTGSSTVTITITTSGGTPIQDANVQIWNSTATALVTYGVTNSNGQIQKSVDDGVYKVKVRKGGYSFSDPFDLTVSGDTSQTYTGTTFVVDPPSEPELCRLYGYLVDGSESAIEDAYVHAVVYESPTVLEDNVSVISPETITATTSSTGLFTLDLVQGVKFTITIPDIGYRRTISVPTEIGPTSLWSLSGVTVSVTDEDDNPW